MDQKKICRASFSYIGVVGENLYLQQAKFLCMIFSMETFIGIEKSTGQVLHDRMRILLG
jgi:hypothetical protein